MRECDGFNLLHLAVEGGHTRFVKMALDPKTKKGYTHTKHEDWRKLATIGNLQGLTPGQLATKKKMVAVFQKSGLM